MIGKRTIVSLFLLVAFFISCGEDESTNNGPVDDFMTMEIGGDENIDFKFLFFESHEDHGDFLITASGSDRNSSKTISFILSLKNYSVDKMSYRKDSENSDIDFNFTYMDSGNPYVYKLDATGSLELEKNSDTEIAGTFQFEAWIYPLKDKRIIVSNGSFHYNK